MEANTNMYPYGDLGQNPMPPMGGNMGNGWGKGVNPYLPSFYGEAPMQPPPMPMQEEQQMDPSMQDPGMQGGEEGMQPQQDYGRGFNPNPMGRPELQSMMGGGEDVPMYARGGRVNNHHGASDLAEIVHMISQLGEGEDKILAHINPGEALELQLKYGGNINPHTGLPQYGWFSNIGNIVGKALGLGGGVLGGMFGGPLGALAGGALGGILGNSGGNRHDMLGGALGGALTGGGGHLAANALGSLLGGATGKGGMGAIFGGGGGGLNSLAELFGGGSGSVSGPAATMIGTGGPGPMVSGIGGLGKGILDAVGGPMGAALLGTTLYGMANRKEIMPHQESLEEVQAPFERMIERRNKHVEDLINSIRAPKRRNRKVSSEIDPRGRMEIYFEEDPEEEEYAKGGYLDGHTPGQDDKIPALLSDGEYVIDAQTVANIGDGNNKAGALRLKQFVENIRKYKGQKGFPPKTKPLDYYLKAKKR